MAQKFEELTIDLIDEGNFAMQVQNDFASLQRKMVEFAKLHGDLAEGAKGKLTVEISITCDAPKDQAFSIRAITKTTVPNSPASFNVAMGAEGDGGDALFVRASGGSNSHPNQSVLTTKDGRVVDTNTGEVK